MGFWSRRKDTSADDATEQERPRDDDAPKPGKRDKVREANEIDEEMQSVLNSSAQTMF